MDFAQISLTCTCSLYDFMEEVERKKIQIRFHFHVIAFQSSLTLMFEMAYLKGKHSEVPTSKDFYSANTELVTFVLCSGINTSNLYEKIRTHRKFGV